MTTHTDLHPLARSYLDRLADAARVLPPEDARELVADITDHLAQALPVTAGEAEARTALDRLGTPQELVTAAGGPVPTPAGRARTSYGWLALAMLVGAELLFVIWFVAVPMWLAGLVLLSLSAWSAREKLLGLLVLGTGFPVVLLTTAYASFAAYECTGGAQETVVQADGTATTTTLDATCSSLGAVPPAWLQAVFIALALAYLALQAWTVWRLSRQR
ncbi:hypothetical protein GCM10011376_31210 [Nocardioides flavus (ex Wang et al. 2016)]|uniref:DUF1700 domain-containing protein n=1 Tax=Nocardioides flavus (ex Wang et al. 2016) TaxID=2058780 RepID=A0ABQ3HP56_9ACTN|nr:hypothetical protein [Nocardioides flavus (ex Wang et al. 2016)]GHE18511.1 hypothetical protein GCM10011376_31210 [Nocardioides flavus (ex Wang et al. 2016)]